MVFQCGNQPFKSFIILFAPEKVAEMHHYIQIMFCRSIEKFNICGDRPIRTVAIRTDYNKIESGILYLCRTAGKTCNKGEGLI